MKVKIFSIGKTKEAWLEDAFEEYVKRLSAWCEVQCFWFKSDDELTTAALKEKEVICLDPQGKQYSSIVFAEQFSSWMEKGGARLTFVIGGPDGLPKQLLSHYPKSSFLSLSPLTLTHQITRLVLIEQIYRAFTIISGLPYNK